MHIKTNKINHEQQKRPIWKPHFLDISYSSSSSSSSPLLSLSVREELRVVQYSKMEDYVDVSGTIMCRADVSGVPTLTIPLNNYNRAEYVYMHECCVKKSSKSTKLTSCPPSGRFTLCTWCSSVVFEREAREFKSYPSNSIARSLSLHTQDYT